MEMELDDRKKKILYAIIKTLPGNRRTGQVPEPFPSIADLKLSSATIRNEMSDLEEMGYIIAASYFGRQDSFRQRLPLLCRPADGGEGAGGHRDVQALMIEQTGPAGTGSEESGCSILAADTNYASMITSPQYHQDKAEIYPAFHGG